MHEGCSEGASQRGAYRGRSPLKRKKTVVKGRQALGTGLAVALTAGAAWFGIGVATAGGEQGERASGGDRMEIRGWQGKAVDSVAQARRSAGGDRVLTVVAVEERGQGVDVGAEGDSAGDFFIFEESLYYPTSARKAGRDTVRCELGIRSFSCEATFLFSGRGKIRVAGALFPGQQNIVLPVTGGTKDFSGVGGQLRVLEESDRTLLVFELVR